MDVHVIDALWCMMNENLCNNGDDRTIEEYLIYTVDIMQSNLCDKPSIRKQCLKLQQAKLILIVKQTNF